MDDFRSDSVVENKEIPDHLDYDRAIIWKFKGKVIATLTKVFQPDIKANWRYYYQDEDGASVESYTVSWETAYNHLRGVLARKYPILEEIPLDLFESIL